ncbi:hypothetical protein KC726_00875 [Candidatus Woesebacteria bacterium]|nr:hypothetical protein [Candidatus Woesebacteria bacterium]
MDTKKIVQLLQNKKTQNYTYNTIFFVIFSVFVLFAIRPNLVTAFNLQKELQDLKLANRELDAKILKIVELQSVAESYRDQLPLLDEALPDRPNVAKVIEDVRKSASDSGMLINSITAEQIVLAVDPNASGDEVLDTGGTGNIASTDSYQHFQVDMVVGSGFENMDTFLGSLLTQRRLKGIDSVSILSDSAAADAAGEERYTVTLLIGGYYL